LQAALGNHRIALKHFEERERLPFVRPEEALAFRLARARSAFHADEPGRAAAESRLALQLVEATPSLARFRPLALERAMFCHFIAEDFVAAAGFAASLEPLLPPSTSAQVKTRLAGASALLHAGDAPGARRVLSAARAALDAPLPLHTTDVLAAHGPTHLTADDLRALLAGLEAEASGLAGDAPAQLAALVEREALLARRQQLAPRDETLHALAQTATRQARTAATLEQWSAVREHLERAFRFEAEWRASTGTQLDLSSVARWSLCAEVSLRDATACPRAPGEVKEALLTSLEQARRQRFAGAASLRVMLPLLIARLGKNGGA
jgi:hypothetical protein